jgi:hypothetical protein
MSFWSRLVLASLSLSLVTSPALADAIAPLIKPCSPPQVVGIRGHMEVCLDPAPEHCPPGWRGIPGGTCALYACSEDGGCTGAARCVDVPVCFETRERDFCYSAAPFDPALLAGPPRECRPDERSYETPTNPCGPGAACDGKCKPTKLCLAPGQTAAVNGNPGAPSSGPGGTAPPRGGCAGCSAAGSSSETALALLMVAVGLVALGRGRREGRGPA